MSDELERALSARGFAILTNSNAEPAPEEVVRASAFILVLTESGLSVRMKEDLLTAERNNIPVQPVSIGDVKVPELLERLEMSNIRIDGPDGALAPGRLDQLASSLDWDIA